MCYLVPQLSIDLLSRCVIHYCKQGIDLQLLFQNYFFLQFCQFCFIYLGVVWYIFYSCYMFLMEWTCHYIVPFASCDSLDLKFILCDISIAIPDIASPPPPFGYNYMGYFIPCLNCQPTCVFGSSEFFVDSVTNCIMIF